jgi:hypothetical protein
LAEVGEWILRRWKSDFPSYGKKTAIGPTDSHPPTADSGRVEPEWYSDSAPQTCRSQVLRDKIFERACNDGLWPISLKNSALQRLSGAAALGWAQLMSRPEGCHRCQRRA